MVNDMKKNFRKLFCLVLIFTMAFTSVCCIAYGKDKGLVYVSLGDSIAVGVGLPENQSYKDGEYNLETFFCYKTPGSYPVLLAERLGVKDENFYQLACSAMRITDILNCLDPAYNPSTDVEESSLIGKLLPTLLEHYDYQAIVKKADVITLNIGSNDVMSYAVSAIATALTSTGVSETVTNRLTEDSLENNRYLEAYYNLVDYASKLNNYNRIISIAINELNKGLNEFKQNWDALCKRIYKLNPDVKLVCLGIYNPFGETKLSDDSDFAIGSILDGLMLSIDSWCATGSKYAKKYTYVSVIGTETILQERGLSFTDEGFFDDFVLDIHPSLKGHQEIANKIINQLTAAKFIPAPVNNFISASKSLIKTVANHATKIVTKIFSIFK